MLWDVSARAARRPPGFKLGAIALLALALATPAAAEERLAFIGVALDQPTRQADALLQDYLHRRAGVAFAPEELEYARVIDRLANWAPEEGHLLARTTPYVYVAAEMLGADLEILATYTSATTGSQTYGAYFVVRRADFPAAPALDELIRWLRSRPEPARFVYHSKFSTSSFFLPSLYFRQRNVFHMPEATASLAAIHSRQIEENSSTALVRLVAAGEADLAAVWDGTRARFETGGRHQAQGEQVHFIRLPTALPNDLLVCSASLAAETKAALRAAIEAMGPAAIDHGDFETWVGIREATEARQTLAELRWLARQRTAPVTVEIRGSSDGQRPLSAELLEAARQAVRLSGTEFVLYDEDYHEHVDYRWTLEGVHDGAVVLRSLITGSGLDEQVFRISFRDTDGLTSRIALILRSRMHRIRYVWPYSESSPIVIRDTAAALARGAPVKVQRISWLDPPRNEFRQGPVFDARLTDADFYRYALEREDFARAGEGGAAFDAMSNVAYRVILVAPRQEQGLFGALTIAFVALLALAAGGAAHDLRRRRRRSLDSDVTELQPPPSGGLGSRPGSASSGAPGSSARGASGRGASGRGGAGRGEP